MTPLACPKCKADLDAGPIPEQYHEFYSYPYRFSRVISMYDADEDRHDYWICPYCDHEWR